MANWLSIKTEVLRRPSPCRRAFVAKVARAVLVAGLLLGSALFGHAALIVNLGTIYIPTGSTNFSVPVEISGGDALTDFVGRFQIADGGPRFGGTIHGPKFAAIDLAGSIFETAPGGFSRFDTLTYPTQVQELNVSLNAAGTTVACSGTLCTLRLDTAGYSGRYDLKLVQTIAGDTAFANAGVLLASSLTNGSIAFGDPPLRIAIQQRAAGMMRISIPSKPDRTYQVQWSPVLEPGSWSTLTNLLQGDGSVLHWDDDGSLTGSAPNSPAAPRRFYRVIIGHNP